jgi:hypothetical protein
MWVFLLVHRETHTVVKCETVTSISPSPPQIVSLKKIYRPEATLHLSTDVNTVEQLVSLVQTTITRKQCKSMLVGYNSNGILDVGGL